MTKYLKLTNIMFIWNVGRTQDDHPKWGGCTQVPPKMGVGGTHAWPKAARKRATPPLSLFVAPSLNTMFRLEQEGEHIHKILNSLERVYKPVANKPLCYFHMIAAYENKIYCTK